MAQCNRIGVVYESEISILAPDYNYQPGDYLLVEMVSHMDTDSVLLKVRETLGVTDLNEVNRSYGSNCIRILLGDQ